MLLRLIPHPDAPPGPLTGIEVEVARSGTRFDLRYIARGRIKELLLPPKAAPTRRDELWKHTCFEAFLGAGESGYVEVNLSPSNEWAAYRFTTYRAGLTPATAAISKIETVNGDGAFEFERTASRLHEMRSADYLARIRD